MKRGVRIVLLLTLIVPSVEAAAQNTPAIHEDLRKTYGAYAAAMVAGDVERASLAGRYANPAGAAAVYSSTWERQADGSWKLAASVPTLEASDPTPARSDTGFACTQVLGFSQSMEWYAGLSVVDHRAEGTRPEALAPDAFLPGWQGRFFMGAAVEQWRDPGFAGWSGAHRLAHETPAHCGHDEVDRVVFNVSGAARSPDAWAAAMDSVADVIRSKFPAVRRIVMQPVVGASEGSCPDVRAARNHPAVAEGIRRAAHRGAITAGPVPKVASCDQFSDALGHLTLEGAEHVRRTLREHYRRSTVAPERDGRAAARASAPELLRRPYTGVETGEKREYFVSSTRPHRQGTRRRAGRCGKRGWRSSESCTRVASRSSRART